MALQLLPADLLQRVLCYVNEESLRDCIFLCKELHKELSNSDGVWKTLSELTFDAPVFRRFALLPRFSCWADMALHRPRVRTDGVYVQEHSYIRRRAAPTVSGLAAWMPSAVWSDACSALSRRLIPRVRQVRQPPPC